MNNKNKIPDEKNPGYRRFSYDIPGGYHQRRGMGQRARNKAKKRSSPPSTLALRKRWKKRAENLLFKIFPTDTRFEKVIKYPWRGEDIRVPLSLRSDLFVWRDGFLHVADTSVYVTILPESPRGSPTVLHSPILVAGKAVDSRVELKKIGMPVLIDLRNTVHLGYWGGSLAA